VPPGVVTIAETVPAGITLTGVTATGITGTVVVTPATPVVGPATATATVTVPVGTTATGAVITFTDTPTVQNVKICKVAGPNLPATPNATFTVSGAGTSQNISVTPGNCVITRFPTGAEVTVVETGPANTRATDIVVTGATGTPMTSVAAGTTTFVVGPGETIATFTNVPTGFLELCKAATGDFDVFGNYTFRITTAPGTFTVPDVTIPVGTCSAPFIVPAGGTVRVTEALTLAQQAEVELAFCASTPADRIPSFPGCTRTATGGFVDVRIVQGGVSQEARVTFFNRRITGELKICKVAGEGVTVGQVFTFVAGTQTLTVPAGPGTGFCEVFAQPFAAGTNVLVREEATSSTGENIASVSAITVSDNRLATGVIDPNPNLGTRQVAVQVGAGQTVVTYTNVRTATGRLQVCKESSTERPVSGNFSFTVSGVSGTVTVPTGQCSPALTVPAGTVTVTEALREFATFEACRTLPDAALLQSCDPNTRTARVLVPGGPTSAQTVLFIRNRGGVGVGGLLKICKVAGTGFTPGTQTTFIATPTGLQAQTVTVPAGTGPGGTCEVVGELAIGTNVTVQETVPAGSNVSAITVSDGRGVGTPNLATGTVTAQIGAGVTEVTFTNVATQNAQLTVCKVAGANVAVGSAFTAQVNTQTPLTLTAGSGAGNCVNGGTFPVGTVVNISESGLVTGGTVTFTGANVSTTGATTAQVTIAAGGSTVTLTNAAPAPVPTTGNFRICKVAGAGVAEGTSFQFSVTISGGGLPFFVNAQARAVPTLANGGCVDVPGNITVGTQVQVTENVDPTLYALPTIELSANANVIGITSPDATFRIVGGTTVLTYTNRAR